MQREKLENKHRREREEKELEADVPALVNAFAFSLAIPHSYWLYQIIWSDPCSTAFFSAYELSMSWIATTSALDGAAACALGYIDYKTVTGNSHELIMAMRKKRLAFAKLSFMMAVVALLLIDKPSPNSVLPLIVGQVYTGAKIGTQIGFNLTPEKFFVGRTLLCFYNLAFLIAVWYKLR